jgi:hypothetical protein
MIRNARWLVLLAAALTVGCGVITAPVSLPAAFARNGDLGLKGTIADDLGEPLDQVLVHVDRTYYLWHAEGSYNEYSKILVAADRQFEIKPMRAHELTFTFKKSGYTEQSVTVDQEGQISAAFSGGVRGSKWPAQEVRMVLRKLDRPQPALNWLNATVNYTDPEKMPAIDLSRFYSGVGPGGGGSTRVQADAGVVQLDPNVAILPPGMLFAVIQRQPLRTVGPERRVDPLDINLPARLALRFSDPDGGFTPLPGSGILEQMGQAPESGLTPELVLDAERLRKMRDPSNEFILDRNEFFFFRAGGEYGKGIVSWSSEQDDALKLNFTLLLQPDGTRNLAGTGMGAVK